MNIVQFSSHSVFAPTNTEQRQYGVAELLQAKEEVEAGNFGRALEILKSIDYLSAPDEVRIEMQKLIGLCQMMVAVDEIKAENFDGALQMLYQIQFPSGEEEAEKMRGFLILLCNMAQAMPRDLSFDSTMFKTSSC